MTLEQLLCRQLGVEQVQRGDMIQQLWSGYGEIVRCSLPGAGGPAAQYNSSVVVKAVSPPDEQNHPRGWNTSLSHQRKLDSYHIEMYWYQHWSARCDQNCRVPVSYWAGASSTIKSITGASSSGAKSSTEEELPDWLIIMEDIDAAGFHLRKSSLSLGEVKQCLRWLAYFHACFLGESAEGLWPVGTYWHLATRPDELAAMSDSAVKNVAVAIDAHLSSCRYQTIVHGDAKLANFCFSEDGSVAAVDFQYVGGGCGMKDVAYFLGSCLNETDCEVYEQELLGYYFRQLGEALTHYEKTVDIVALQQEWRALYAFAWTDFYRFLLGWMPDHWKINRYTRLLADEVLRQLC